MAEPVQVEAKKPRASNKALARMVVEPRLGGGHTVTHEYAGGAAPKPHHFTAAQGEVGMTGRHILKHAGLPSPGGNGGMNEEAAGVQDEQ